MLHAEVDYIMLPTVGFQVGPLVVVATREFWDMYFPPLHRSWHHVLAHKYHIAVLIS